MTPQTTHFVELINQLLPEPHASLLAGMLFGVRRTMPDSFYESLVTTGTLHVIALSGMNVSIVIRLMFGIAGVFMGRVGAVIISLLGIISFVWLVGPSPTVVRASAMGSISIAAVFLGRKDIPIVSLIITALVMVLTDFSIVANVSFQLSFAATLGIILFGGSMVQATPSYLKKSMINSVEKQGAVDKHFEEKNTPKNSSHITQKTLKNIGTFLLMDLRVSLAAQVFTVPIIMYYFSRVSLVSPFTNLMTGWLVGPITYLGIVTVIVSNISLTLGKIVALVTWVPLTLFIQIVTMLSKIPLASLEF